MAEAKRRMRRRRVFVAAVALVLAAAAIALAVERSGARVGSVGGTAPTHLTLRVKGSIEGRVYLVFHLSCNPPRGNVPQPAQACAAIAAEPTLITKPKPFVCLGNPYFIAIAGRMNGKAVHTNVATCWTRQMALINKLGLDPPRH